MPMDEVIRAIEHTDSENIQDVLQVAIGRYRELYPRWKILFVSADMYASDARSQELLTLIRKVDAFLTEKSHVNIHENSLKTL